MFGQHIDQSWAGPLSPEFKGQITGFQAGLDLFGYESPTGHIDRAGLFYAHTETQGTGTGTILAVARTLDGTLPMSTDNPGAYWTHIGPNEWYVDAVVMGTFMRADPRSSRGIGANLKGEGLLASLEAGYPLRISPTLVLEPQAQVIWQHLQFDPSADPFTTLRFNLADNVVGRIGARLEGDMKVAGARVQPYALVNLWHVFSATDSTLYNSVFTLPTQFEASALAVGGGIAARVNDRLGVYARGSYTTNVGGSFRQTYQGTGGLRVTW